MAISKLRKYLPAILTAVGSGGVLATGYFSAKAGVAIKDIVYDETKTKEQKRREIVKEALPACLTAGTTIACIVASNVMGYSNTKEVKTEMAAGYVLIQNAYNQYRKKIDAETNEKVLKQISEEKVKVVTVTSDGKYPWTDMYHNDPWYAAESDVFWAEIKTKEMLQHNLSVSLHFFYEVLRNERGCDIPYVPNEEELLWDADVIACEWDACDIAFSNLYDEKEDGGRLYTLDFFIPPYPESEIEKILKEQGWE